MTPFGPSVERNFVSPVSGEPGGVLLPQPYRGSSTNSSPASAHPERWWQQNLGPASQKSQISTPPGPMGSLVGSPGGSRPSWESRDRAQGGPITPNCDSNVGDHVEKEMESAVWSSPWPHKMVGSDVTKPPKSTWERSWRLQKVLLKTQEVRKGHRLEEWAGGINLERMTSAGISRPTISRFGGAG